MTRCASPSDLSDAEWHVIEPLTPPATLGGRPRTVEMREILHDMFGFRWFETFCPFRIEVVNLAETATHDVM